MSLFFSRRKIVLYLEKTHLIPNIDFPNSLIISQITLLPNSHCEVACFREQNRELLCAPSAEWFFYWDVKFPLKIQYPYQQISS